MSPRELPPPSPLRNLIIYICIQTCTPHPLPGTMRICGPHQRTAETTTTRMPGWRLCSGRAFLLALYQRLRLRRRYDKAPV